jgi:hypothetical protein
MAIKKSTEIQILLKLVAEGYSSHAWHGPNLRGSIRGLSAKEAAWRPASGRHNIWEIVLHAAYWKYITRRRLLGEKRGSFPLKGSNWIRRPVELSEKAWRDDIRLLDDIHMSMRDAISSLAPGDLRRKPFGSKFNNLTTISGIACHDIYHAGQIQLIKRLMKR